MGKISRNLFMILILLLVEGTLFAAVQGFLAVEAIDGVQVYVNGEMKGITVGGSSVLMLDPGSYRITLEKEGYSSTTQSVTIKAGEATNLKVNMTKPQVRGEALGADDKTVVLGQKTGTVEIRSVPFRDADILINGVNYGKTDRRLSNMPVGPIRVQVTYNGKRLYGSFTVKENETIQLQANYAMDPAQIIQLYDATFVLPNLPEGVKAELVGEYGSGAIVSGQQTRVMGSKHKVRYTYGKEYIELADEIDLEKSTYVRLGVPDMALVAKVLPIFTVAFDSNGGNPVLPIENVMQGVSISSPIAPTRSGYKFEGWYKDKSLGDKWNFGTDVVVADMTLYAKWLEIYTVSLNNQGGTGGNNTVAVTYGSAMPPASAPTKVGYAFEGYYDAFEGKGKQYYTATMASARAWDKVADSTLYAIWSPYEVGKVGPSGGYIFYDKGNYSDGWRYLEAAPASNEYRGKVWGGYGTSVGGTGTAIGTGAGNTEKIVTKFENAEPFEKKADYAAKLCADLVVTKDGVRYDDWFLPSKDELNLMYQNLKVKNLGGFSEDRYWSSSESGANFARYQYFGNGSQGAPSRDYPFRVRPVRAF